MESSLITPPASAAGSGVLKGTSIETQFEILEIIFLENPVTIQLEVMKVRQLHGEGNSVRIFFKGQRLLYFCKAVGGCANLAPPIITSAYS
jgi:hypothetical protein